MMVLYAAPNSPTVFQILDSENLWDDFLLSEIASLSLLYMLPKSYVSQTIQLRDTICDYYIIIMHHINIQHV